MQVEARKIEQEKLLVGILFEEREAWTKYDTGHWVEKSSGERGKRTTGSTARAAGLDQP